MAQHREDPAVTEARIREALRNAQQRGKPGFVGFLDLQEAAKARTLAMHAPAASGFWGGYPDAQRVVFGAFPDYLEPDPVYYPVTALEATVRRSVVPEHRAVLGSLMALGIERDTVGDLLTEAGRAVIFVRSELAQHIVQQLTRIGGEGVSVRVVEDPVLPPPKPLIPVTSTIASPRADCIVAVLAGCGRTAAAETLTRGAVSCNGEICTAVARELEPGDILSIRGIGKFRIESIGPQTKKGRLSFRAGKYQ